jgi:hypothetical protein
MAIYIVHRPNRDFAIGAAWATKLGPGSTFTETPGNCIVCGAPNNSCKGDGHGGAKEIDSGTNAVAA